MGKHLAKVAIMLAAVTVAACSGSTTAKKVGTVPTDAPSSTASDSSTTAPKATAPPTTVSSTYKVGDKLEVEGDGERWSLIVHAAVDPYVSTEQFSQAPAGTRYVSADVEVTNLGSGEQSISSLISFAVTDSTHRKYTATFVDTRPGLDGTLAAGGTQRGFVVFEVPAAATGLSLTFTPGFGGSAVAVVL